jgi:hypothetical protein
VDHFRYFFRKRLLADPGLEDVRVDQPGFPPRPACGLRIPVLAE